MKVASLIIAVFLLCAPIAHAADCGQLSEVLNQRTMEILRLRGFHTDRSMHYPTASDAATVAAAHAQAQQMEVNLLSDYTTTYASQIQQCGLSKATPVTVDDVRRIGRAIKKPE